jgi:SnoaL-like domain
MDIVREVLRLKNIEAIRTLIAKYALAADAYSPPDMMRPLFSRLAGWHCAVLGAHYDGLDAVTKGLAQVRERAVLWTMHFNVAPLIEVSDDGTTGTAFWYLWELARTSLDGGTERQNTWIAGSYQAAVLLEDDAWRFGRMDLSLRLVAPAGGPAWPVD